MKHIPKLYAIIAIAILSVVIANPQTGSNPTKHYDKDGLAFDYPEGWEIADSSTQELRTVTLARNGSVAQIVVNVQDGPTEQDMPIVRSGVNTVTGPIQTESLPSVRRASTDPDPCDFESVRKEIADALSEKIAMQIDAPTPHTTSPVTTQLGESKVEGRQFQGMVNHQQVTAAVYSTRLNHRFVSLGLVRADHDELASTAWNIVCNTLKVAPGVTTVMGVEASGVPHAPIKGGVLNGRAIRLPAPNYPAIARQSHASGLVVVQVTIDETGAVISAHAVAGHPLLQAASLAAARDAQFSPTKLCGEPVRVTGVITYNFVAR